MPAHVPSPAIAIFTEDAEPSFVARAVELNLRGIDDQTLERRFRRLGFSDGLFLSSRQFRRQSEQSQSNPTDGSANEHVGDPREGGQAGRRMQAGGRSNSIDIVTDAVQVVNLFIV